MIIKLIHVPENQKTWFNTEFDYLKNSNLEAAGEYQNIIDLNLLKRNIFGANDRLINYTGPENTVFESFWIDYARGGKQNEAAIYIIKTLKYATEEAAKLEFYELAENLKNITGGIVAYIIAGEKYANEILNL